MNESRRDRLRKNQNEGTIQANTTLEEVDEVQRGAPQPPEERPFDVEDIVSWSKIGESVSTYNARFKRYTDVRNYEITHRINTVESLWEVEDRIDNFYSSLISETLENCEEDDMISAEVYHENLNHPLYIPPFRKRNFNKEEFLNSIFQVSMSNSAFLLDGKLSVKFITVKKVSGEGKRKAPPEPRLQFSKRSKSVVCVQNADKSCGFRAIFIGKYLADNGNKNSKLWLRVRNDNFGVQTNGAKEIAEKANLNFNKALTMGEFNQLQDSLTPNYQLVVIDASTKSQIYVDPDAHKIISIEYEEGDPNHYNCITKLNGYFGRHRYCIRCAIGYNDVLQHKCKGACIKCRSYPACNKENLKTQCYDCNIEYYGELCYANHKNIGLCTRRHKCNLCKTEYNVRKDQPRKCNEPFCKACKTHFTEFPHYCFLTVKDSKVVKEEDSVPKIFVFYDIESMQVSKETTTIHQANLVISLTVCDRCFDHESKEKQVEDCELCGKGWHIFESTDCVKQFCDLVYSEKATNAKAVNGNLYCFAHNAKGYDSHFILRDLFERKFRQKPEIVMTGTKILKIEVGNVRFMDSLSFLLLPLSKLPKVFNLKETKGHFPHLFNTPENQNYNGPLPCVDFFTSSLMKREQKLEVLTWYNEERKKNQLFNLKDSLRKYCRADVLILCQSVLTYRQLFINITDIDPFTRNFTLASIGLETFRTKILKPETLGIAPIGGYKESKNYSKIGATFIDLHAKLLGKRILKEQKIGPYWVDGYLPDDRTVYEFFGCRWHGCEKCFPDQNALCHNGLPFKTLLASTKDRIKYFIDQGYKLVLAWECEFKETLKGNEEHSTYFKNRLKHYYKLSNVGRLDIRDAFFGGRTNNIFFTYEKQEAEEIDYFDFTSLYPTVLWENPFFLGHPEIITEDFTDVKDYFGFIKCKVLPPTKLHIPVLPVRVKDKLMFPLCKSCTLTKNPSDCFHSDDERTLLGTWTTMEVQTAVKYGYQLKEIYEINHYKQKSENLFKNYIKLWLKIKQEASGWPNWVTNDNDKHKYVNDYKEKQGVELEMEKINKNSGLRWIAKIMLNSFWGKLAQRPNLPKAELIYDYARYWSLLTSDRFKISGEVDVNEDVLLLNYKLKNEEECSPGNTNIGIAAFVTAYARLKLYEEISKIEGCREGRVLYFDTDSIIFTSKANEYKPKLGDFLGQMTDEIADGYGDGSKMIKFAACGPKNYAYLVNMIDGSQKTTIKTKGIRLTAEAMDIITMETIVKLAKDYINGEQTTLLVPQTNIKCNSVHELFTNNFEKVYRTVSDKRRIVGSFTRPYGYVE